MVHSRKSVFFSSKRKPPWKLQDSPELVTLIDFEITQNALKSALAFALKAANFVDTDAMNTWVVLTIVHVRLAVNTHDARHAYALVPKTQNQFFIFILL